MNRAAFAAVCVAALTAMAVIPSWAAAAPGTVTDDTQPDFAAGTTGTATEVVAPGSVRLAKAREDFGGDALPPGFSSMPWSAVGAATVDGDELTVDGALVAGSAAAGAPRSLEFSAAFGTATFENIGYGTDFTDGPWATFSTGTSSQGYGLFARVSPAEGAGSTDVAIPDVDPTALHTYRIEWAADAVSFYVDGARVDTEPVAFAGGMRPLISDFAYDGTGVTVDWMVGHAYVSSGAFESRVLDAGDDRAAWDALTAQGGAGVTFATRTGDTATPDASWSGFQAIGAGGEIRSPRGRYLQYRATLTTADPTTSPSVDRVHATFDVDTVAPAVSIAGVDVVGTAATFRFSSPAADVARYECRLDGGAYAACTAPKRYTGLAAGPHTLAVRAIDAAGNVGAAASRGFSVAAPSSPARPPVAPSRPAQPPVVSRAPAVRLTTTRARASHTGIVTVSVACSAGATPCRLSLRLQRGGRRLAQRTITVAAGTSRAVRLRLSRSDRRELGRAHRLTVTEVVSLGGREAAHRRLTLLSPRR